MNAQAVIEHEKKNGGTVALSDDATLMQVIGRAASDPNFDVDKVERLFALRERMLARSAEIAFNDAMAAAQKEIPRVVRDRANDHTKSRYATLDAISKAITPVVTAHGFSLSFGTEDSPHTGHYRIICTASHSGGHSRQYHADLPADVAGAQGKANKTPIQGFGSTVSYGRRYLTMLIFNVAISNEDDDGNAATQDTSAITEEQAATIRKLIEETGAQTEKFCAFYKIDSVPELPASRYKDAVDALNARKRASK